MPPTLDNVQFLIATVHGTTLPVLLQSFNEYGRGAKISIGIRSPYDAHSYPDLKIDYFLNQAQNFGDAYNYLVGHYLSDSAIHYLCLVNDDIVLDPSSIALIFEDYKYLSGNLDAYSIGYIACRTNFSRGVQNIRFSNNEVINGIKYPHENTILQTEVISPILALIKKDNWLNFPPINWFSDDIQCYDMRQLGMKHFVSRSYCHHVGSQSVGPDHRKNLAEALPWIQENRQEMLEILGLAK
jgi:hypothetical protein